MTRQQAIEKYLKQRMHGEVIVQRLMKWNPNKNLNEIAESLGVTYPQAREMSQQYSLKYKAVGCGAHWKTR